MVLVPYGGGTNVTQALMISPKEKRMVVSVDMTRMKKIKWVDKVNMTACVEAGIIGQDLERELKSFGVCSGHEPVPIIRFNCVLGLSGVFFFGRVDLNESQWHEEELLRQYRGHRAEHQVCDLQGHLPKEFRLA